MIKEVTPKVYVASSWRNEYQPKVVELLRQKGCDVYDFRNPRPGDNGFDWKDIDPDWQNWSPSEYRDKLSDPISEEGYLTDFKAMKWADIFVGVQPFGRSASLEIGWASGKGKHTIMLLDSGEPELMIKMCDIICVSEEGEAELIAAIKDWKSEQEQKLSRKVKDWPPA